MHFGTGKSRDMLCCACRTERCDTLVTTSATAETRTTRVQGVATAWTGVDLSTTLFKEVVPKIDANPEHKRLNLYTPALLLRRRPPCWNEHGATYRTRRLFRVWT